MKKYETDVAKVESDLNLAIQARYDFDISTELMKNFVIGNQYISYDFNKRSWRELEANYSNTFIKEVFNIVRPYRNTYASILMNPFPTPVAVEDQFSPELPQKLEKTNQIIERIKLDNDFDDVYIKSVYNLIDKGNAATKIYIKPIEKSRIHITEFMNSKFYKELDLKKQVELKQKFVQKMEEDGCLVTLQNEVFFEHIDVERIYAPFNTFEELDENPYIFDVVHLPIETAKKMYAGKIDESKLVEVQFNGSNGERKLSFSNYEQNVNSTMQKGVRVVEKWTMPNSQYKKGRLDIIVGGQTAYSGDWPFIPRKSNGKPCYPIRMKGAKNKPNTLWQDPMLQDIVPIQRRLNAVRNRQAEYLTNMTYPTLVVNTDSIGKGSNLAPGPGKMLVLKKGAQPPTYLQTPQMTGDLWREGQTIKQEEASMIAGISSMRLTGEGKSGVRTEGMQNKSLETDLYTLDIPSKQLAALMKETIEVCLWAYKQIMKDDEKRVLNQDDLTTTWTKEDLITKVHIENINELSMTQESIRQERMQLLGLVVEFIGAGMPSDMIAQMLGASRARTGVKDIPVPNKVDIDKATRENKKLVAATPLKILEFDNHQIHLSKHQEFMMTPEFETYLSRLNEIQRQMVLKNFSSHIEQHTKVLQQQAAVAQANQAAQIKMAKEAKEAGLETQK